MIGDSLRDDVCGAKSAGINSFHLDRSQHTLWDALSSIGVDQDT
ncbi:Hydrolase of HAD-superfamily protein [Pseudomonas amygdali pv. lachrymans]|nr:Hydrolase of HAD-superfamily protein [Pseudomonas amygdali pv. lachrymans]